MGLQPIKAHSRRDNLRTGSLVLPGAAAPGGSGVEQPCKRRTTPGEAFKRRPRAAARAGRGTVLRGVYSVPDHSGGLADELYLSIA